MLFVIPVDWSNLSYSVACVPKIHHSRRGFLDLEIDMCVSTPVLVQIRQAFDLEAGKRTPGRDEEVVAAVPRRRFGTYRPLRGH